MNYHEVPDDVIMEFYVQANILRSHGGIRQTIKTAYMTIWLDDFDSIVNSIWMKQGIIVQFWSLLFDTDQLFRLICAQTQPLSCTYKQNIGVWYCHRKINCNQLIHDKDQV
jgi:hypothetical protein